MDVALAGGPADVTTDVDLAVRVDDRVDPVDGLADGPVVPAVAASVTGAIASSPTCSRT